MTRFRKIVRIFIATLEEIFDEAAYARFLQSRRIASSPDAYAAFWRERQMKPPNQRCC